ncbi:UDP-glucose 4-epimerase GalE [Salipaludibacillus sp. HK11]|uniref:UDP-glucose 4-epimerase GalE n=1 Tax=Salipaludibacillus sp. HK11 TaxID=3394320 RepID=UPI0039FD749B
MAILVTGGAGYIGSHTCVELLEAGNDIVVLDNLSNSQFESLRRVKEITGKHFPFYEGDLLNIEDIENVFNNEPIDAVIHFAGLKAVGESVEKPLYYYHNNITSTVNLCGVMKNHGVKKIVFSSSATVYGMPDRVPISEDFPLSATNPYGRSKLIIEEILGDLYVSDKDWGIVVLRYFNPIGSHESGRIGENPNGIPNNLMPYIAQVAVGKLSKLKVFGDDYHTEDGTGVRDYIHVVDLAKGHLKALEKFNKTTGVLTYNLGTGRGYSVLEMVKAFEQASGRSVPYKIAERRPGDIGVCYADPTKSKDELSWVAEMGIEDMCRDSWRWQETNPHGYNDKF